MKHKVLESRVLYSGKIIGLQVDRIEIDGQAHVREVVRHPGGVVVLGLQPDGRIPFVRQHRYPMDRVLLELPAGKIDEGEDPARAAARELEEETGFRAPSLEPIFSFYPTPGFCDELLHLFFCPRLVPGQAAPDEDEVLENVSLTLEEALEEARRGRVLDGKTLTALYWLLDRLKHQDHADSA